MPSGFKFIGMSNFNFKISSLDGSPIMLVEFVILLYQVCTLGFMTTETFQIDAMADSINLRFILFSPKISSITLHIAIEL